MTTEAQNETTPSEGFSRRGMLARAGGVMAGGALLAAPIAGGLARPSTAAAAGSCSETVGDIINIAAIAEALAVTTYYTGIQSRRVLGAISDGGQRRYLRGALSAEKMHLDTLMGAGASDPQHTFHYEPGTFASVEAFGETLLALERAFISAYGAAVHRLAEINTVQSIDTAQLAARILGVEAEHRTLARDLLGKQLTNNVCLEPALFTCVSEAATALTPFLNGSGGHTSPHKRPTSAQVTTAVGKWKCQ